MASLNHKAFRASPDATANYFSGSADFRPNHFRVFGFGSSAGGGVGSFSSEAGSSGSSAGSFCFALALAAFRFAFFSSAAFSSMAGAASTHSMNAMEAESLFRWPSLTMRV
jgi:hypothetical protein